MWSVPEIPPASSTNPGGYPQTITDRNGNSIAVFNYFSGSAMYTALVDNLQRSVTIENVPGGGYVVTQSGYGGASLTWSFGPAANSNSAPFTFYYDCQNSQQNSGQSVSGNTCPMTGYGGGTDMLEVPSNDPNNPLVYTFQYGALSGLLQTVTLPTGASTTYSYQCNNYPSCFGVRTDLLNPVMSKQVTWYDQADGGSTQRTELTTYGGTGYSYGMGTFTKTAPDGGVETSYLAGAGLPVTTKMVEPNGDSTDYFYQVNVPYGVPAGSPNPAIAAEVHNLAQNGNPALSSVTLYQNDKNGNQLSSATYDWASYSTSGRNANGVLTSIPAASGSLLRNVQNVYSVTTAQQANATSVNDDANAYWNAAAPRFLHLLASSSKTGVGPGAFSTYLYDGNANPTQAAQWDSTKSASPPSTLSGANATVTNWTWDGYGNLTQQTDPLGLVTKYTYDANSLYLSQKVQAFGTSVARTFSYGWDTNLGLLTSKTDVDNSISTNFGYDGTGRLTSTLEAAGLLNRRTLNSYDDANRRVTTSRDQVQYADGRLVNVTSYDQLGRVALTQQMEGPGDTSGIKVQKSYQYSGSNSYRLVSNPYRASTSGGAGGESTMGWTLSTFDQNNRQIFSSSFNGSTLPAPWGNNGSSSGTVTTSYNAQNTTVIDQNNAQRTSAADALGRLSSVMEYPQSGNDVASPNTSAVYTTGYSYDALDNLIHVTHQTGQTRTFVYDSLKRLSASTNPENFTPTAPPALGCAGGVYAMCYSYDSDGNLTSKTDNRGMQIFYQYDALNRMTGKSYNSQAAVSYSYDSSGNYSKGLLSSVSTLIGNTSTTTYGSYDALGRILLSSQATNGQTYSFSYHYNLAGSLLSEAYPSGRVVNTCYDGANRVSQVGGASCGSASGAYASNFQYAAHGAATQYVMGNNLWHLPVYNARLQMSSFAELVNNNSQTSSQLLAVTLDWGGGNNNGNLRNASYSNAGPSSATPLVFNQSFLYDGANRLFSAMDSGGWSRSFTYDAVGNMTAAGTPAVTGLSFNGNNQITAQTYDQTGNQQTVNGNTLAYDFEDRIVSETDGVSQALESYVYDGDGKRVEKYGPNGTPKTVFVYDAMGRMAAEYDTAADSSPCTTCYLSYDHLGTVRLVTDSNAVVMGRHDYLPFGEELGANVFGRNSDWGPAKDDVNQKFTGKERDSESGLDYFGARYYGSALGRFTSVDPENAGSDPSNPQSWNAYSYVLNSPLSNTDPDGEDTCKDGSYADVCVTDTPPDPIQTVPFPRGPSQQPPTSNPAPVQPGPVFNTPSWNNNNCVTGFAIAGAGVFGAMGADVGFDIGAVGGAAAGTLVEPGGGTLVGGVAGGVGGAAFGGGLGAYYGGRFGASLGSIVCASGSGSSGGVGGATGGSGASANDNKKADDLIRGRLKASKSYHAEYGSKTYGEIKNLAKQGDRSAQQMKKLIEQGDRLMQKLGGK